MDYRTRLLSEWDVADVRAVTIAYRTPMLSGARVETCHHAAQAVLRVRRPDIPEGEISGTVSHMIAVVIREHGPWFYGRGR